MTDLFHFSGFHRLAMKRSYTLQLWFPFESITTKTLIHSQGIRITCSWLWNIRNKSKLWVVRMARLTGALDTEMIKWGFISLMDNREPKKAFAHEKWNKAILQEDLPNSAKEDGLLWRLQVCLQSGDWCHPSLLMLPDRMFVYGERQRFLFYHSFLSSFDFLQLMAMHHIHFILVGWETFLQSHLHVLSIPHRDECGWQFGTYCLDSAPRIGPEEEG